MRNRTKSGAVYLFLSLLFVVFVVFSAEAFEGARKGLEVSAALLLPTLFPFFVFSKLFVSTGFASAFGRKINPVFEKLFHLPGVCSAAFLLGLLCGFPVGAETACTLYRQGLCTREEAERTSSFCSNPSLAFVVSMVGGGMYHSVGFGFALWGIQTLVSVGIGIIFGLFKKKHTQIEEKMISESKCVPLSVQFCSALADGFMSTLSVAASVIFFFSLNGVLTRIGLFSVLPFEGIWRGVIEMTGGVQSLSSEGLPALPYVSAILGWSGFCVIVQIAGVMTKYGCSVRRVIVSKIVQAIVSFLVTLFVCPVLESTSVFAESGGGRGFYITALCSVLFGCAVILLICALTFQKNLDGRRKI